MTSYRLTNEQKQVVHHPLGYHARVLAASMQSSYPGITKRDVRYLLEYKFTDHIEELAIEKYFQEWGPPQDRYANYLTADELCQQSGLSKEDLSRLQKFHLLVPDISD